MAKKDLRIKIVNNDRNHGLLYSRAMGILTILFFYIYININIIKDSKLYLTFLIL